MPVPVLAACGVPTLVPLIMAVPAFDMVPIRMQLIMGALEPSMMPILVPLIMVVFVP